MSPTRPDDTPAAARLGLARDELWSTRQALVDGLLPLALQDDARRQAFTARVTTALVPAAGRFTTQVVGRLTTAGAHPPPTVRTSIPRARRWRPYALAAALAASLVIALVVDAGAPAIATLAHSESATWEVHPGPLTAGTRVRLIRGLAEFDLHGRGRLVVEGPADLELATATRTVLHRGRLVLNVTPAGHGHRIETPSGTLVDLGTRFGVSVGTDGSAEAHVLEGAIIAIPGGAGSAQVILRQDDAARLSAGRLERVTADPGAFYTTLPPPHATRTAHLRWRCDEGNGVIAKVQAQGLGGPDNDLTLRALPGARLPQWITGQQGHALAFDGRGAFAESAFPGIAGSAARTVACWIRMPRDFTAADGFAIVSWGAFSGSGHGAVWQLSLNPVEKDGPLGRVRVGTHGGLLVGSSDLRDDTWHHIAAVMYGGARADIGTHVLVYVDGHLETISRRTLRAIDTRIATGGHGVWVGRNVTYTDEAKPHPQAFLRGAVDDLVITAGALSQAEIRALMEGP